VKAKTYVVEGIGGRFFPDDHEFEESATTSIQVNRRRMLRDRRDVSVNMEGLFMGVPVAAVFRCVGRWQRIWAPEPHRGVFVRTPECAI